MASRIGGPKAKVTIPKKSAKTGSEPLPHFGGKASKTSVSRGGAPVSGGNVSANRGAGGPGGGGNVSANRGVAPAETPSVSRGGSPSSGPVSGGRFGAPVDTFNPGKISGGRF